PTAITGLQKVIAKDGMYELGIDNNQFYFKAGDKTLKTDTLSVSDVQIAGRFIHLTGMYDGNRLLIYVNGELIERETSGIALAGNDNPVQFGGGVFAGIIDEVRIWSLALSGEEISRDYKRYLTGGETGLIAYYTFNYAVDKEFYDLSFAGTKYNENHGTWTTGVSLSDDVPTVDQLGYKGITAADGSYSVRAIPYQGNGTAYRIIPRMGIHSFESEQEVRFIGAGAQSHTVNFTDKSSFKVTGWVTYENATIPVQGVSFTVDGKTVLKSNGTPEETAADGRFEIRVPVGTHEVKAVKINHTFVGDGRITNQYGLDLNYQDEVLGVELKDNTTVKFIGRVAGGTIQEAFPIGHSLSTNNLAEGITVTLAYPNEAYKFDARTVTETHFKPSNKNQAYVNRVEYGMDQNHTNAVTVQVNDTTGEFVAYIIPEQFNVTVNVPGHSNISGSGELMNLSQRYFGWQEEIYAYRDSVPSNKAGEYQYFSYSDTVKYQVNKKFIKRYAPEIRVTQLNTKGETIPWFGSDTIVVTNLTGEQLRVPLFDGNQYTFGKPVFEQHTTYRLKMELFEKYVFYGSDGLPTGKTDEVPTQDAVFKFNNDIAGGDAKNATEEADDKGTAFHSFPAGYPDLTTAIKRMELTVTYGKEDNPTSINWIHPANFANGNAYIIGARQRGTDFVTAGPDKLLTVLRDPPGSLSYAYLEKGVTFSEANVYTGAIHNEGSEEWTTGVKQQVATWTGVGGGTITGTTDIADGTTVGIVHEEEYQGQDTKSRSTTTTTRFQTSADPDYVGADGDVYIGYATNITVGSTDNVTALTKENFEAAGGALAFDQVYTDPDKDWVLVQNVGMSLNQTFKTLFAYPQVHIENRLIPGLEELRNNLLLPIASVDTAALRRQVNADPSKVFYVSYFDREDPDFGKSNEDESIKSYRGMSGHGEIWKPFQEISFDGPSYKVIYNVNKAATDTICYLNQSIDKWIKEMSNNEERKAKADKLLENYSFQGGALIEYSESYANARAHESSFYINVGAHLNTDFDATVFGVATKFVVDETAYTSEGGASSSEVERSHTKGFVLKEEGSDYLSVDVLYEPNWEEESEKYKEKPDGLAGKGMINEGDLLEQDYYSSFIFKTKGGATSCPYEDIYVSKYFEPEQHTLSTATLRVEVPKIDMPVKFIENVPSGETAKLQLYLRNESESKDDGWYNLKIVNTSNPDGARMSIDGAPIGNGLEFMVAAGGT
ncbi:MAG: LamG domain-containing protein, partial [Dysgonamonadaceae bacterium]|nr:LamG domain-containing protein [Dysgonamonadaceae bacterium]